MNVSTNVEVCDYITFSIGSPEFPNYKSNRVYSSAVERLTADQQVPGSNPGVPSFLSFFLSLLRPMLFAFLVSVELGVGSCVSG